MVNGETVAEPHGVSVVVPVYQGRETLRRLLSELIPMATTSTTDHGARFRINEVLLVDDNGPDSSDEVIRELAESNDFVRPIWLSRNFGQHAATLAGMASSASTLGANG
jgi:undecaprenyl-phosphate 4-deoxy-4-formamido-L-arabinose transferase